MNSNSKIINKMSKHSPAISEISVINVEFGEKVKIIKPVNIYGCKIGSNCFVGPFVEIQKNVVIGQNTKIQSHTFICELVRIGQDCLVGHGVMFINDLFSEGMPANGDKSKWKETQIGNHVSIGSNTTILPVNICNKVVIGAGSVVTKDIKIPGFYAGNPARMIRSI